MIAREREPTPQPVSAAPAEKHGLRTTAMVILAFFATAAALYFGREFFVPIVFAILLNALFRPVVRGMERLHIPSAIGGAIVVLTLVASLTAAGFALSGPLQRWMQEAPDRFTAAQKKLDKLRQPVRQLNQVANQIEHAASGPATAPSNGAGASDTVVAQPVAPAPAPQSRGLAARFLDSSTKALTAIVEVLLLLFLLLAAGDLFVKKLIKIIPLWRDKKSAEDAVEESQGVVMRYLLVTLAINTGQGIIVGLVMWWLKMPSPLLWGFFTVILEFIPYMGATVMIALLSIIAFAAFDDIGHTLAVPASYLVITTLQNNVVSPYLYGQHLKLNPVAVFIGVLLWWFLWGIPGAFLAVPIIATFKIIADHVDTLKPVGEFLGE
jgi:predicted PurR-regulated permease PerM